MFAYCGNEPIVTIDIGGEYRVVIIGDVTQDEHNNYGKDVYVCVGYYTQKYSEEEVTFIPVLCAKDFVDGWNSIDGPVDELIIICHGSKKNATISCGNKEKIGNMADATYHYSDLKNLKVTGEVTMYTCYAAKECWNGCAARYIAQKTNSNVLASTEAVYSITFSNIAITWSSNWTIVTQFFLTDLWLSPRNRRGLLNREIK